MIIFNIYSLLLKFNPFVAFIILTGIVNKCELELNCLNSKSSNSGT